MAHTIVRFNRTRERALRAGRIPPNEQSSILINTGSQFNALQSKSTRSPENAALLYRMHRDRRLTDTTECNDKKLAPMPVNNNVGGVGSIGFPAPTRPPRSRMPSRLFSTSCPAHRKM